jgi:hypothetical protein
MDHLDNPHITGPSNLPTDPKDNIKNNGQTGLNVGLLSNKHPLRNKPAVTGHSALSLLHIQQFEIIPIT